MSLRSDMVAHRYTHRYTGPDTRWGLKNGTLCAVTGSRAGGKVIRRTHDGRRFLVSPNHVEANPIPGQPPQTNHRPQN